MRVCAVLVESLDFKNLVRLLVAVVYAIYRLLLQMRVTLVKL